MRITCVIPALNEQDTVSSVVKATLGNSHVAEVVVVDNGSVDETAIRARDAGARVIYEPQRGLGHAMLAGIREARTNLVLKTDADIVNFSSSWIDNLVAKHASEKAVLTRAVFDTEGEEFPLTNLVVLPLIELVRPNWLPIRRPLSGTYLVDKTLVDITRLPTGWAFDLAIYLGLRAINSPIAEVDIGLLNDKIRPIIYYRPVARELIHFVLSEFGDEKSVFRKDHFHNGALPASHAGLPFTSVLHETSRVTTDPAAT